MAFVYLRFALPSWIKVRQNDDQTRVQLLEDGNMLDPFPITTLPLLILEQVIRKLDSYSFFRIQQTCRVMNKFIYDNQNISCFASRCELREDGKLYWLNAREVTDFRSLSCIRFQQLAIRYTFTDAAELTGFANILTKYCITAVSVEYYEGADDRGTRMTPRHFMELFNVLNPEKIELCSRSSNRFEALFLQDLQITVKEVLLYLDSDSVLPVTIRLLSGFQKVVIGTASYTSSISLYLLTFLLEELSSVGMAMCNDFFFDARWTQALQLPDELLSWFNEVDPMVLRQGDNEYLLNFSFAHTNYTITCDVHIFQRRLQLKCAKNVINA